ncbi:GNAT family N-acetyltransferase [Sporosarcina cyprini]|uniref:GNAT family N-acetyltransferase n=1 Tax=Sporosarcina cyprini TaxID=2910523 RepID=UPI001EDD7203|nr:GNAT family N-acetyltransferase [Sporosarcina cyprini]MCG3087552.1 N-acetyltransferase family protein [Sporosarcina cyprini]
MIRKMESRDLPAVLEIYQQGMDTRMATFETHVPTMEAWDLKFHPALRFVFEENDMIVGWISLTPISSRAAYRGVGEVSVYIRDQVEGRGIGTRLLLHLEEEARNIGYWMLQSSIFEINEASIRLHKRCGFRIVGIREKIAERDGVWHNNCLMEKRIIK